MNSLPSHLLDEILFRLDLKSLAMMSCTNISIRSHIFDDPNFEIQYFSRVGSSLLHISKYESTLVCFHPFGSSRSFINKEPLDLDFEILSSCSGLLLLLVNDLFCVANPLRNKLRFLDDPLSNSDGSYDAKSIGFAIYQIDRTTQRFIIVCVIELVSATYEKTYQFKINAGDSWRLSKTTITCNPSDLMEPVYLDNTLHWLREDGSIVTFNLETEQARVIPIKFHRNWDTKLFLGASDNQRLGLISATEEEAISVFALENNDLTDPKWILVRLIEQQSMPLYWNVEAFVGNCLLVTAMEMENGGTVVHVYDLRANKWEVIGSIPGWCDVNRDFYLFKPSWSSTLGLEDQEEEKDGSKLLSTNLISSQKLNPKAFPL